MREDLVDKYGANWTDPGKIVSLGPYLLTSHEADSKIVLKANPTYYGARGNVDEVDILVIKDDSSALSLYEAGKLDFLSEIASFDLKRLAGRADLKSFPYLKTAYLGFVVTKHPTNNRAFRRAISMAIDHSKLGGVLHGGQDGATSFVPPRMLGFSARLGLPFDPAKAKAELKASGIDTEKTVSIEMILPNWDKELALAQFVRGELKKNLGIEVVLQPFDNKTFHAQQELKTYPLFSSRWVADYPDPDNFMSVFLSTSGNNRTGWKSDKYDELVVSARELQDSKAREKIYTDAQRMLIEDEAVIAPLFYEPVMALVKPRVRDLELNPVDQLLLRKVTLAQ
jgi:oligopeptide transport system substrate-binding protein